jgi:hypothetical protein
MGIAVNDLYSISDDLTELGYYYNSNGTVYTPDPGNYYSKGQGVGIDYGHFVQEAWIIDGSCSAPTTTTTYGPTTTTTFGGDPTTTTTYGPTTTTTTYGPTTTTTTYGPTTTTTLATGIFSMASQYGFVISGLSSSNGSVPSFTYPVTTEQNLSMVNAYDPAPTFTVNLEGGISNSVLQLDINGSIVDCEPIVSGITQSINLVATSGILITDNITIDVVSGPCPTTTTTLAPTTTTTIVYYTWYITNGTSEGCGNQVGSTAYYTAEQSPNAISAFYTNTALTAKYQPGTGTIGWNASQSVNASHAGDIDANGDITNISAC